MYILGIGIGTFIGNMVFVFGGRFIVDTLNANQRILHWIIGGIFLLTAIILMIKVVRKKDITEQSPED